MIGTGAAFTDPESVYQAGFVWGFAYLGICVWTFLHLSMSTLPRMGLPNGLSFLRMGISPLLATSPPWEVAGTPTGAGIAVLLALLAATDFLDGFLARLLDRRTRLGSVIDPMADVVFITCLAVGLHNHGMLPNLEFSLLLVRYPGVLSGAILLFLFHGPAPIRPTLIGKATTLLSAAVLVAIGVAVLARPSWLPDRWLTWSLHVLVAAVLINLVFLIVRVIILSRDTKGTGNGENETNPS